MLLFLVPNALVTALQNLPPLLIHAIMFRVSKEWCDEQKISKAENTFITRGRGRLARLIKDKRQATNAKVTALYNRGTQNDVSRKKSFTSEVVLEGKASPDQYYYGVPNKLAVGRIS